MSRSPRRARPARQSRVRERRRLRLLFGIAAVAIAILGLRLGMVQVLDGARYAAYATGETDQKVPLPAIRGAIYDRYGHLLALSVPRVKIVADDFQVTEPLREAEQLAPLLHQAVGRLVGELSRRDGYVVLAPDATSALATRLENHAPAGLAYLPVSTRVAPDAALFEPLLGGVNTNGTGVAALEEKENATLAGRPGSEVVATSPSGAPISSAVRHLVPPRQGQGLVLTIDESLQVEVTKDLAAEMRQQHAHTGVAVVEAVHSGAILAMVDLQRSARGQIVPASQNLAETSVYEPGSVMKIGTFSYAIKDGVITPRTPVVVPFEKQIGGYFFQDAEYHPTQVMTASQILAQSSNVGTIEIAGRLGMARLHAADTALGFGRPTGLGWPGASPGIVGPAQSWVGSYRGSVPIGTGISVTPQQILDAYVTVANGGVMPTPHLVQATVSPTGVQRLLAVHEHRVLPSWVAHELIPMFEGVVHDGTAACAAVPGYAVGGKTGTSQVPRSNGLGYVPGAFNATFVGFVPAQAPQLAAVVTLNRPQTIYGGSVGAPVFAKVMEYALRHYGIPPAGPAVVPVGPCTATSGA